MDQEAEPAFGSARHEPVEPDLVGLQPLRLGYSAGLPPMLFAVAGLALSIVFGAAFWGNPEEDTAPQTSTHILRVVSPGDPAAIANAVQGLAVTSPERKRISAAVAAGDLQLGHLTLWDWKDQDGDAVAITSAGFVQTVEITRIPKTIVIPFNGPGEALITGLHDGGGGITVAVATQTEPLQFRPLLVGESMKVVVP